MKRSALTLRSDASAAEELFRTHRDLARRLASRYRRRDDADDMEQVAEIALWDAARRFDASKGAFERFAVVTISGELKKHLRRNGWVLHVSRQAQEDALAVDDRIDVLRTRFGRAPTVAEVADAAGLPVERVHRAMRTNTARYSASTPIDDVGCLATEHADLTTPIVVDDALRGLSKVDRTLVELTHVHGLSQRECGRELGMSQSRIHRRLDVIYATLRDAIGDD